MALENISFTVVFNPYMPSGLCYLNSFDRSSSNRRDVYLFLLLLWFTEIHVFNANSVDSDQMPHSVASDLVLRCLPMPLLWDTRHKWVKTTKI